MAIRVPNGKHVLSAGEIGAFTVCPEAWRLRMVEKVDAIHAEAIAQGNKLHQEWARKFDESVFLLRGAKLIIALVALAAVVYALV